MANTLYFIEHYKRKLAHSNIYSWARTVPEVISFSSKAFLIFRSKSLAEKYIFELKNQLNIAKTSPNMKPEIEEKLETIISQLKVKADNSRF